MTQQRKKKETGSEVVLQFLSVVKGEHRIAACFGGIMGGLIPLCSYIGIHYEVDFTKEYYLQWQWWVVVFCLGFSLPKVYQWARIGFQSWMAGACFALAIELVMISYRNIYISLACLLVLMSINAISAGANIALKRQPKPTWMA